MLAAMRMIGSSASPEVSSKYWDAQVAAGAEDYYLGRDESPGQWRGSGASALDLTLGARAVRVAERGRCERGSPAGPDDRRNRARGGRRKRNRSRPRPPEAFLHRRLRSSLT